MAYLFARRSLTVLMTESLTVPGRTKAHLRSSEKQFIDWRRVSFRSGNGGNGCAALKRGPNRTMFGPAGGDGGEGGSVYLQADHNVKCLRGLMPSYRAKSGGEGEGEKVNGKNARDVVILVPCGTIVRDKFTQEVLCDLVYDGHQHRLARGGHAGIGNMTFKTPVNQAPRDSVFGGKGEVVMAELEMKTIADVGLVGFPNAGKSSFLRIISRATPKVASYPFTTLHPHVGAVDYLDDERLHIAVADIPGIIEGAHQNKGLGFAFLKHIERCGAFLFVIDVSSGAEDAVSQYEKLSFELEQYQEGLSKRPAAIIATKVDIAGDVTAAVRSLRENSGLDVQSCSAITGQHLDRVKQFLRQFQRKILADKEEEKPPEKHAILSASGGLSMLNRLSACHSE